MADEHFEREEQRQDGSCPPEEDAQHQGQAADQSEQPAPGSKTTVEGAVQQPSAETGDDQPSPPADKPHGATVVMGAARDPGTPPGNELQSGASNTQTPAEIPPLDEPGDQGTVAGIEPGDLADDRQRTVPDRPQRSAETIPADELSADNAAPLTPAERGSTGARTVSSGDATVYLSEEPQAAASPTRGDADLAGAHLPTHAGDEGHSGGATLPGDGTDSTGDALQTLWGSTINQEAASPGRTLRLDKTLTGGSESTLMVRPRSVRSRGEGDETTPLEADYELLDKIGEGGMGVVYAARQLSISRRVAVKMLKGRFAQAIDQREKFKSEAVVTGELDHPNIVPIHDLGSNDNGELFYSMKHVVGTPWVESIRTSELHDNLDRLLRVCDAVAFAHDHGVVHRDLKPENVMLGDYGEVLVMDWGLALATEGFENPGSITQSGSMGGTPAYMAPEMATGPIEKVGFQADIYLLGAILYEIVTGQLPHTGTTVMECLRAASRNEIQPTTVTGELVDIAYRAMATDPDDRYASVKDFQAAIRGYLEHSESLTVANLAEKDLAAARESQDYNLFAQALFGFQQAIDLWEQNERAREGAKETRLAYAACAAGKGDLDLAASQLDAGVPEHLPLLDRIDTLRRERESRKRMLKAAKTAIYALVAAIFLLISGAAAWIYVERNEAVVQRNLAQEARGEAEAQRDRANDEKLRADRQRDAAVVAEQSAIEARDDARQARDEAEAARGRAVMSAEEERLAKLAAQRAREREEYEAYVARIGLVWAKIEENAFDAARSILAQCRPELRNWEWGRLHYLCNQDVQTLDAGRPLDAAAFSPDGRLLAAGSWDGKARIWDTGTRALVREIDHGQYVHAVAFTPDGEYLATAGSDRNVQLHALSGGARVRTFAADPSGQRGHSGSVLHIAFSPDGSLMLTSSYDNTARLWNVATGAQVQVLGDHLWWVWCGEFSPDAQRLATASQDGKVIVWRRQSAAGGVRFEREAAFLEHQGPVYSVAFSPDGKSIASGGYDKRLLLWDPDDIEPVSIKRRLNYQFQPPPEYRTFQGHTGAIRSLGFSPDGERIASGAQDNTLRVWHVPSGRSIKTLRGHGGQVRDTVFAPTGEAIASASHDGTARLWKVDGYFEYRVLRGQVLRQHRDAVLSACFSPDGERVLTASRDRTARTWNAASGEPLKLLAEGHEYLATVAQFTEDGRTLVTGAGDDTVRIWNVATGGELQRLEATGRSGALAVSQDGRWILTGGPQGTAKLWDASTGTVLSELVPPALSSANGETSMPLEQRRDVTAVAISSGGRYLYAGDSAGRGWLWRSDNGPANWSLHHTLKGHSKTVTAAAFTAGGQRLLTASGDTRVLQWDVATGQVERPLTLDHSANEWINAMDLARDGQHLLTGTSAGKLRLWNLQSAQLEHSIQASEADLTSVAFSPDGRTALTTSALTRQLKLWDLDTGQPASVPGSRGQGGVFLDFGAMNELLWAADFAPQGDYVVTVGGNVARLWHLASGTESMSFSPHGTVASASYSPDGSRVVTGSWDNSAKIWNVASGHVERKLVGGHESSINSAVFSPDGHLVLTAGSDGVACLWEADTGELLPVKFDYRQDGRPMNIAAAVFSPDTRHVALALSDGTARICSAETGEQLHVLSDHDWAVRCIAYSPDGRQLITGSADNTAKIWDARQAKLLVTLSGHSSKVSAVAFSPSGTRVLTGSEDNSAKLWDAMTGKEILTLDGHDQEVTGVDFAPAGAGHTAVTASRDGTVILWPANDWSNLPADQLPAGTGEPSSPAKKGTVPDVDPHPETFPAQEKSPTPQTSPEDPQQPTGKDKPAAPSLDDLFPAAPQKKPEPKADTPAEKTPAAETPDAGLFPVPKDKPAEQTIGGETSPRKPDSPEPPGLDDLFPAKKPKASPPESPPDSSSAAAEKAKPASEPAKPAGKDAPPSLDDLFPRAQPMPKTPDQQEPPAKKEGGLPGEKPAAPSPESSETAPATPSKEPPSTAPNLDDLFPRAPAKPSPAEKPQPAEKPASPPEQAPGIDDLFPSSEKKDSGGAGKQDAAGRKTAPGTLPSIDELFPQKQQPSTGAEPSGTAIPQTPQAKPPALPPLEQAPDAKEASEPPSKPAPESGSGGKAAPPSLDDLFPKARPAPTGKPAVKEEQQKPKPLRLEVPDLFPADEASRQKDAKKSEKADD